jgi:hypothetical protein
MSGFSLLACAGSSAVIIWKCFNVVGHLAKEQYKRELARAILTSTLFTIGSRLPSDCTLAFEAVFTDNLLSVRGFIRSCIASLAIVTALFIVWYLSIPDEWHLRISNIEAANDPDLSSWWLISMRGHAIDIGLHSDLHRIHGGAEPMMLYRLDVLVFYLFLYNIGTDFIALIFTERILATLSMRHTTMAGLILTFLLPACMLLVLAFYALEAAGTTIVYIINAISRPRGPMMATPLQTYVSIFMNAVWFPFYKNRPDKWNVGILRCICVVYLNGNSLVMYI